MKSKLACLSLHANKQMHVCVCKTLGLDRWGKKVKGLVSGEVRGGGGVGEGGVNPSESK